MDLPDIIAGLSHETKHQREAIFKYRNELIEQYTKYIDVYNGISVGKECITLLDPLDNREIVFIALCENINILGGMIDKLISSNRVLESIKSDLYKLCEVTKNTCQNDVLSDIGEI